MTCRFTEKTLDAFSHMTGFKFHFVHLWHWIKWVFAPICNSVTVTGAELQLQLMIFLSEPGCFHGPAATARPTVTPRLPRSRHCLNLLIKPHYHAFSPSLECRQWTSHRSDANPFAAQAARGAQDQELVLLRTEGVPSHEALLKQPGGRRQNQTTTSVRQSSRPAGHRELRW